MSNLILKVSSLLPQSLSSDPSPASEDFTPPRSKLQVLVQEFQVSRRTSGGERRGVVTVGLSFLTTSGQSFLEGSYCLCFK